MSIVMIVIIIIIAVHLREPGACEYGKFSKIQVCFCGLDPGNLKFETVRTNKQHVCF